MLPPDLAELCDELERELTNTVRDDADDDANDNPLAEQARIFMSHQRTTARKHFLEACGNKSFDFFRPGPH